MEYILGGIVYFIGGPISFIIVGIIIFFFNWSITNFAIGGLVGVLLRLAIYMIVEVNKERRNREFLSSMPSSISSSISSSSYLSNRENVRHTSSSSPITR